MKKRIIAISIFCVFMLIILPNISAVEYNEVLNENKLQIAKRIEININSKFNKWVNLIEDRTYDINPQLSCLQTIISLIVFIFNLFLKIVGSIMSITATIFGSIVSAIAQILGPLVGIIFSLLGKIIGSILGTIGSLIGLFASVLGPIIGFIFGTLGKIIGLIFGSIATFIGWLFDLILSNNTSKI